MKPPPSSHVPPGSPHGARRVAAPSPWPAVLGGAVWVVVVAAASVRSAFVAVTALALVAAVVAVALVGRVGGAGAPAWTRAFAELCARHRAVVFVSLGLSVVGALTGLLLYGPVRRAARAAPAAPARVTPAAPAAPPGPPVPLARIDVEVDERRSNGHAWDPGGGAPDLALCVGDGPAMRCLPMGHTRVDVYRARCPDALRCTFVDVPLPEGPVWLEVLDVDTLANDVIGAGLCDPAGTGACTVGQARLRIERAGADGARQPRR